MDADCQHQKYAAPNNTAAVIARRIRTIRPDHLQALSIGKIQDFPSALLPIIIFLFGRGWGETGKSFSSGVSRFRTCASAAKNCGTGGSDAHSEALPGISQFAQCKRGNLYGMTIILAIALIGHRHRLAIQWAILQACL